jgi:ribosomal protein L14E/L6E/L27E
MERIDLSKYKGLKSKSDDLALIKKKIIKITGIEPESIKLDKNNLRIKCKNNYEALEVRYKIESINKEFEEYKISIL